MLESDQAVQLLADTLERLGAPLGLPEDWIILTDNDDLRLMQRSTAKKLLAQAKRETAHRWLCERFDPSEVELELQEEDDADETLEYDDKLLKQQALKSIGDVFSLVCSLRSSYATLADTSKSMPSAHEATVAARIALGYAKERPARTDCFDETVERQCRRIIHKIYNGAEQSSGPVVYVISAGDPDFVKIGFTTCLEQRLKSLRTATHVEPIVHAVISGSRPLERELHRRFASARHSREWFRLTKEIEAFIAAARAKS